MSRVRETAEKELSALQRFFPGQAVSVIYNDDWTAGELAEFQRHSPKAGKSVLVDALPVNYPSLGAGGSGGWDTIDATLAGWAADGVPTVGEENFEPPSRGTIHRAQELARQLREHGGFAPQRVTPDGDGGISISRRTGDDWESVEVESDGSAHWYLFRGGKLVADQSVTGFLRSLCRPIASPEKIRGQLEAEQTEGQRHHKRQSPFSRLGLLVAMIAGLLLGWVLVSAYWGAG